MTTARPLLFVRHGATAPNLAHRRCGGDHDAPLVDTGRMQAREAAVRLAGMGIGVIVTSDLRRTRETAAIIAAALGGVAVIVEPRWRERSLGAWNGLLVADTEASLHDTPPGGEADADFIARVELALPGLVPLLPRRPLLVASKGVARALGQILGQPPAAPVANAQAIEFDLAPWWAQHAVGCAA